MNAEDSGILASLNKQMVGRFSGKGPRLLLPEDTLKLGHLRDKTIPSQISTNITDNGAPRALLAWQWYLLESTSKLVSGPNSIHAKTCNLMEKGSF